MRGRRRERSRDHLATINSALDAALQNEILINGRPVVLDGGVPLFDDLSEAIGLECTSVAVNEGVARPISYPVL